MYRRVVVFQCICRSLSGLSEMAVLNVLEFVALKMLHNLVFMQKSLFENNC